MANKLISRFRRGMFKLLTGYDPEMIVFKDSDVKTKQSINNEIYDRTIKPRAVTNDGQPKLLRDLPMQGRNLDFSNLFINPVMNDNVSKLYDINEIQTALNSDIDNFVKELMGEPNPNLSNSNQIRHGSKGSLVVTTKGPKTGLWYMHETGKGGNLLQLIQEQKQFSFQQSLEYAAKYLGIFKNNTPDVDIPYHQKVYGFSKSIKNTLGETYLKEHRGISSNLPDTIKFVPFLYEPTTKVKHPAIVVFAKDISGQIRGMQAIYLDKETGKKLDIELPKRSYGEIKGSLVPINNGKHGLALCEGVETALSIANAKPSLTVLATLSSFTNFLSADIKGNGSPIILCIDNDGYNSGTANKVKRTITELSDNGFNVFTTMPKTSGFDFNDVLKHQGLEAVGKYIDNARLALVAAPIKGQLSHKEIDQLRSNTKLNESHLER